MSGIADSQAGRTLGQEPAWTRWAFGQWDLLLAPEADAPAELGHKALLQCAAHLQRHEIAEARDALQRAVDGCESDLLLSTLVSGVFNSLGRARALASQPEKAWECFQSALRLLPLSGDVELLARARADSETLNLGLPSVAPSTGQGGPWRLPDWIQLGLAHTPDAAPLLIAAAESAQRNGDLGSAIRYWQKLAAVDGVQMEPAYYERLEQAYEQIGSFFPMGNAEEETRRGDMEKREVLKHIHKVLQPCSYLEIGIQNGRSLALAACPAIGVDPMPMVTVPLSKQVQLARTTSDHFFAEQAPQMIKAPLDLAFIDGMHLFEYALRDFMNIERYSGPHTVVVIDDILPGHPAQAERDRRTRAWTGDVWKLFVTLRQRRPDLTLLLLDSNPTGLLCIAGLDPASTVLMEAYEEIINSWPVNAPVPDAILSRKGVLSCKDPELDALLTRLRDARTSAGERVDG